MLGCGGPGGVAVGGGMTTGVCGYIVGWVRRGGRELKLAVVLVSAPGWCVVLRGGVFCLLCVVVAWVGVSGVRLTLVVSGVVVLEVVIRFVVGCWDVGVRCDGGVGWLGVDVCGLRAGLQVVPVWAEHGSGWGGSGMVTGERLN